MIYYRRKLELWTKIKLLNYLKISLILVIPNPREELCELGKSCMQNIDQFQMLPAKSEQA